MRCKGEECVGCEGEECRVKVLSVCGVTVRDEDYHLNISSSSH